MILLIETNYKRKEIYEIREALLKESIPCAVGRAEETELYMAASLILTADRVAVGEVRSIAEMYRLKAEVAFCETDTLFAFAKERYLSIENEALARIRGISEKDRFLSVGGKEIYLTKTEMRIARGLITAPRDTWLTPDKLSSYCLKEPSKNENTVSVHISNINKRCERVNRQALILCRRFSGYKLNEDI